MRKPEAFQKHFLWKQNVSEKNFINIFLRLGRRTRNKCCVCGQTWKHLFTNVSATIRNNVSPLLPSPPRITFEFTVVNFRGSSRFSRPVFLLAFKISLFSNSQSKNSNFLCPQSPSLISCLGPAGTETRKGCAPGNENVKERAPKN